jgi:hypothetical protein
MSTKSTTPKPKKIKALLGLDKMPDGNVTPLLDGSLKGLTAHADIFPQPPVDLKTYGAAITAYEAAIPVALDGSKTAVAQKNKLKLAAVKMYTQIAHYVEANCNEDMATFLLSGFTAANTTKTPPQPLALPSIASVTQGSNSGQLKVKIGPEKKALSYVMRYAPAPANGATPQWSEQTLTTKKPVLYSNLTPGTTYIFQVKALGRLGYTDWSDAVSRMVT